MNEEKRMGLDRDMLLGMYRDMLAIRVFEENVMDLYARTVIPGIAHVSIGQEAVPVGVCTALRSDDYITSTHRGHGHCLAKGATPDRMFAELFGKVEGYCRGKGGSMHIADPETGNLGANAIVGGSIALAAGAALGAKRLGTDRVVACFFGDGAINQGLLLESMNMAALWKLPVLYVCENNQYGEYTPMQHVTAGKIIKRGEAFDIPSVTVDGMDVCAVYQATTAAVERARAGDGPSYLVCVTYRFLGHGMSDRDRPYRTRDEEQEWRKLDPIERLGNTLLTTHHVTQTELDAITQEVNQAMADAIEFGMKADYPDPQEVKQHVFAA
jgi:pyruvate dehydrogenase E1 component alpha subunit